MVSCSSAFMLANLSSCESSPSACRNTATSLGFSSPSPSASASAENRLTTETRAAAGTTHGRARIAPEARLAKWASMARAKINGRGAKSLQRKNFTTYKLPNTVSHQAGLVGGINPGPVSAALPHTSPAGIDPYFGEKSYEAKSSALLRWTPSRGTAKAT